MLNAWLWNKIWQNTLWFQEPSPGSGLNYARYFFPRYFNFYCKLSIKSKGKPLVNGYGKHWTSNTEFPPYFGYIWKLFLNWAFSNFWKTIWLGACFWLLIRSSTIANRRLNLVRACSKFDRRWSMVDDLIGDQKQALDIL